MKPALGLLVLLFAGCAGPVPAPTAVEPDPVPEALVEEGVEFSVLSPLWVCAAVGCAGKSGDDFVSFDGRTYVGFHLTVEPSMDPLGVGVPSAEVRIVARCVGEHLNCPPGVLAEATGPWPATLAASGFRIADPEQLSFQAEYVGPYPRPVNGSGGDYRVTGTLTWVASSEAAEE